ncbi:hypothetical protein BST81_07565 [Leptolyngbya sp. 'hensonii']|uniref:HpsJ family protein n=1 Tax=Leptolyngbya sp. 'hensonii' TaxID=1922337 RepID=UPI00094FB5AA|nr:HpsJ family protein [Leptolyngbya sp. 'hensonii']OLP19064.1 hypothetical protein BST81_07565 [Leptolyngbya sp. 'hensonii']
MKATDIRQFAPLISLLLKLICSIMILSFIVDVLTLVTPSSVLERQWQLGFVSQLVDRGVVPLVGLSFLLVAIWIDGATGSMSSRPGPGKLVGLAAFLFASLMGLVFLLIIPFHINNAMIERDDTVKRINQEASAAENQVDVTVQQQQLQISSLLNDTQRLAELDKVIKSGQAQGRQLTPDQLTQLQKQQEELLRYKQDPTTLEKQAKQAKDRGLTKVRERKLQLEKQAQTATLKSSLRTGINSLLLAIGYIATGWIGLKGMDTGGGKQAR